MQITLELDYELMKKYADFLGMDEDELDKETLKESCYFKDRLVADIEFVVDNALNPYR